MRTVVDEFKPDGRPPRGPSRCPLLAREPRLHREQRGRDIQRDGGRQGCKVRHLLMASTSSVYGANHEMPFAEIEKADTQLTIYAATKKANESMAHSYAYLWDLPTTMFRFFTVYVALGPTRPGLLQVRRRDPRRAADRRVQPRRHVPRLHPRR